MQLSVISDEIDARLGTALDVCDDLGIRAVELRTVDGVSIVDHAPEALQAMREELANAIVLSTHTGRAVPLPVDRQAYATLLADLRSGAVKTP